jgi:hypothetical protein
MNCRDLDRIMIEGDTGATSVFPPEAEEHLVTCFRCKEIVRALGVPDGEETGMSPALTRLASGLAADISPTQPMAPAGFYLTAFLGIFASIVSFGVFREGTRALSAMSLLQILSILGALGACAFLLASSLVAQMVPGSLHRFRPEFLPATVVVTLWVVAGALFQFGDATRFWVRGWACLRMGFPFALLAAGPLWAVLRRGAILSPRAAGAAAGLLAGLAGTSVLEIHCPNLDLSHILVWHVGVSVLCSLCGLGAGVVAESLTSSSTELPELKS